MRAWATSWFTLFAPAHERSVEEVIRLLRCIHPQALREDAASLAELRLWARASFAALALGLIIASWLVWPQWEKIAPMLMRSPNLPTSPSS